MLFESGSHTCCSGPCIVLRSSLNFLREKSHGTLLWKQELLWGRSRALGALSLMGDCGQSYWVRCECLSGLRMHSWNSVPFKRRTCSGQPLQLKCCIFPSESLSKILKGGRLSAQSWTKWVFFFFLKRVTLKVVRMTLSFGSTFWAECWNCRTMLLCLVS